jgi:hypothetical protein
MEFGRFPPSENSGKVRTFEAAMRINPYALVDPFHSRDHFVMPRDCSTRTNG